MTDLSSSPPPKRRGGQPGNLNALKHGLYIEGRSIRNTNPIEKARLYDLNVVIAQLKDYIAVTYEQGLKNRTIDEFNDTLRAMALASMGLTRLIGLHNTYQNFNLPSDLVLTKKTTMATLVEYYKKRTSTIIDLDELLSENPSDSIISP